MRTDAPDSNVGKCHARGVVPETFGREQLPEFLGRQERQLIFRDARDVIFPCARANELHSRLPDVPLNLI